MRHYFKVFVGTLILGLLLMAEGAGLAVAAMQHGVSFETVEGVVIDVEKQGHNFQLVGE